MTGTITYTAIGKEPTTHTVTLKLIPNISKITIGDTECNASNAIDSTDESDPEGTKQCEATLTYGYSYNLEATPAEGYKFKEWSLNNGIGAFSDNDMASTAFTAGQGNTTIIPSVKPRQTITLNSNGATTNGSETTIATRGETTLSAITIPQRSYSVSGFDISYNNASGATVSNTSTITSNYAFAGWYKEAETTHKIASNASTPVLQPNTDYTDANGKWSSESDQTLYAGWDNGDSSSAKVTLPTITKTGHTCGWTTGTNTTVISYASGSSFTPSANTILHGVCTPNPYTQTTYVRYQNANGTWGDYGVAETKNVNYGSSYAWSRAADSAYQAASVASYTVTDTKTNYVDVYRQVYYIYYNMNGGTGGPSTQSFLYGSGNAISTVTPTPPAGYSFSYWYGQGYGDLAPGGNIPTGWGSNTLTAIYVDNIAPTHTNWWWGEVTKDVARLYVQATDVSGVQTVQCPTSTATGSYNNWYWFNAVWDSGANAWRCDITPATFGHYDQTYVTHLYMYDTKGNGGYYNQTSVGIPANCASLISGYMKDVSAASTYCEGASGSVTDGRDNQVYTVAKINGNLWMTRNLAIGCNGSGSSYGSSMSSKSLTSADSNISSTWSTPTASLTSYSGSSSGYTTAAMECDSTYGAWYNYKAVTAGTISGSSNSIESTYDICPKNWRLPANSEQSYIIGYKDLYRPVAGGTYFSNSLRDLPYGVWWSSTVNSSVYRSTLDYNIDQDVLYTHPTHYRFSGLYVRCFHA